MKRALALVCCLLLQSGCFPFPRTTNIRRGVSVEGGVGAVGYLPGRIVETSTAIGTCRLNLNPSDRLGFDLGLHGVVYGLGSGRPDPFGTIVLGAKVRPVRDLNTLLFGEVTLPGWHAGVVQGLPVRGREVFTLGLATGSYLVPYDFEGSGLHWTPLMALGSASWHLRFGRLRLTPSLVGGYSPIDTPLALVALTLQLAALDR